MYGVPNRPPKEDGVLLDVSNEQCFYWLKKMKGKFYYLGETNFS